MNNELKNKKTEIALFVTCLVDLFRPSVAFATIKLLKEYGYTVVVPKAQSCCGQPAYNSGDYEGAKKVASAVINEFDKYKNVIVPSGSCAGMMAKHYVDLFKDDPEFSKKSLIFSKKVQELISFLFKIPDRKKLHSNFKGTITYHDSCSSLREAGVKHQARELLQEIKGLKIKELKHTEVCCGFGGTFCVKYPQISERMVSEKVADAEASGAEILLSGDLGCLMNIAGRASREGKKIECRHVIEVMADMTSVSPIGKKWREKNDS